MFASLEALDVGDSLGVETVARQGAFQPKAKPRARKLSVVPTKKIALSPPALKTVSTPLVVSDISPQQINQLESNQSVDVSSIRLVDVPTEARSNDEEPELAVQPITFLSSVVAEIDKDGFDKGSMLDLDLAETGRNMEMRASASTTAIESAVNEMNCAKEVGQEVVKQDRQKLTKRKKKVSIKAKVEQGDGKKTSSSNTQIMSSASHNKDKPKRKALFTASASVNEAMGIEKTIQKATMKVAEEGNSGEEDTHDIERVEKREEAENQARKLPDNGMIVSSSTNSLKEKNKRKRIKPAKFADSIMDWAPNNEGNTKEGSSSVLAHAKKKKKDGKRASEQQDNVDPNFSIVPAPTKEKSTNNISKSAKFTATKKSLPATELALEVNNPDELVLPQENDQSKKKFKKFLEGRRRVERRALNPANPDMDPKKMTMRDIIRLAEAKDKLARKGDEKKGKEGNASTSSAPEKEHESACLAPQVQIIDGRLVINQESLTVQAHPKDDVGTYKRVEETHSKLNYHSYMKKTPKQLWRKDETELFYQALQEFGTNFAMIQHLFPGRTRKQVFLKYKKEERCCPLRVSEAMKLKPCEYSRYMEVMSSMNLLLSDVPDSEQASIPCETAGSNKEIEDSNCISAEVENVAQTGAPKSEELPTQSKVLENLEINGTNDVSGESKEFISDKPADNRKLDSQEPLKLDEIAKPCESPKKASAPPRKKSLFSYQTSTVKS